MKRFKAFDLRIKNWIRENRTEFILLAAVLSIGAFLRLYRISEYMTFLGDEGRDVIVVRRFLVDFDLMLVGPGTSIGNMYLGPLYYYMMSPFLLLFNFSPVGPAFMIALLGIITIFFVWYIIREWFPSTPFGRSGQVHASQGETLKSPKINKVSPYRTINVGALVGALLYAIAPTIITYSRSSWNPNIMPFFSLLAIYSVWKFWVEKKYKWLLVVGMSMAFVLQSHYLGLLLIPTIGLFWGLTLIKEIRPPARPLARRESFRLGEGIGGRVRKILKTSFIRCSLLAASLFTFLMSPLVIFDARHGWNNFNAMKLFFTARQTTVSARPWTAFSKFTVLADKVTRSLLTGGDANISQAIISLTVILLLIGTLRLMLSGVVQKFYLKKDRAGYLNSFVNKKNVPYVILVVWLLFAFIGLGVYKQEIYDHYYGFFFAAPFILIGGITQFLYDREEKMGKAILFAVIAGLIFVNLKNTHLKYPPNRQLQRSQEVSRKIKDEAGNEKFNIAVIAERNYEGAYQYYLERWSAPIVMIDPQLADETIANQLYVICELPADECDPTRSDKAEIANFGWSGIENEWQVAGVTLYKLVHTE